MLPIRRKPELMKSHIKVRMLLIKLGEKAFRKQSRIFNLPKRAWFLYSLDEITEIFGKLGLRICNSFADFSGKPSSDNDIQFDGLFHTRIKIE